MRFEGQEPVLTEQEQDLFATFPRELEPAIRRFSDFCERYLLLKSSKYPKRSDSNRKQYAALNKDFPIFLEDMPILCSAHTVLAHNAINFLNFLFVFEPQWHEQLEAFLEKHSAVFAHPDLELNDFRKIFLRLTHIVSKIEEASSQEEEEEKQQRVRDMLLPMVKCGLEIALPYFETPGFEVKEQDTDTITKLFREGVSRLPEEQNMELLEQWREKGRQFNLSQLRDRHDMVEVLMEEDYAFLEHTLDQFSSALTNINLPSEEYISEWAFSGDRQRMFFRLHSNLQQVEKLQEELPGAVQYLTEEWGVHNFGQYPFNVLKTQFETRAEDHPYIAALYPRHDHNDAFFRSSHILELLHTHLDGEYVIRVAEADSAPDVLRKILNFAGKYGKSYQPEVTILAGHGTSTFIKYGEGETKRHLVQASDLEDLGTYGVKDFPDPEGTIVCYSCLVGGAGGFAQALSEKVGSEVIASTTINSLQSIEVTPRGDGHLHVGVQYYNPDGLVRFKHGKLVEGSLEGGERTSGA